MIFVRKEKNFFESRVTEYQTSRSLKNTAEGDLIYGRYRTAFSAIAYRWRGTMVAPYRMQRLLITLFVLLSVFAVAVEPSDWTVHTEFRVVVLPQKDALALLQELRDAAKADGAWVKIDALIANHTATLAALLIGDGESGAQIESRQVEEVRYATEFEAPSIVEQTTTGKTVSVAPRDRVYSNAATTFEGRNVGAEIKLTPTVSADGKSIAALAMTSHVRLLGWTEIEQAQLPDGRKLTIKQPKFAVADSRSQIGFQSGERLLLGIHVVPESPGMMELFLFRGWTTPKGK